MKNHPPPLEELSVPADPARELSKTTPVVTLHDEESVNRVKKYNKKTGEKNPRAHSEKGRKQNDRSPKIPDWKYNPQSDIKELRKKSLSGSNDFLFDFRKMMLMAEMMLRKGQREEGEDLLKKLMSLCHEAELLNECLQLYSLADTFSLSLPGRDGQKKYRQEMAEAVRKYNESVIAAAVFTNGTHESMDQLELKKYLEKLFLLKTHYEDTGFARIGYLYHFSSLCYNAALNYFKAGIFHGERLLEIMQQHPRIFHEQHTAVVTQKLASCYLCADEVHKALEKSRTAVKQSANHSASQAAGLETLFYTLWQKQEYLALGELAAKAQRNHFVKEDRFLSGKWRLMMAAVHFTEGNHKDALKLLKDCCGIPREKPEWTLYAQLLEVMCKAEMGQHEWFFYRAEALRKCISRYEIKYRHSKNGRIGLIYRLLKELHRNGMDYNRVLENELDALDLLRCSEGNYYWNPAGPELIRFESWLQLKARKQTPKRGSRLV